MDTIGSLGGMLAIPQWFVWRLTWDEEENKFQKVPCYPDGRMHRMPANDPANWMTCSDARAVLASLRARNDGHTYTLGFWLSADTGYWFLDIDKCMTNGQLSPLAQTLFNMFPGAAYEWSSSGQGLHIFGRGAVPEHRRKDAHGFNLEFYTDKRGIAFGLSGQFYGSADTTHDIAIGQLIAAYFPPNALHAGDILDSQFDAPVPAWSGPTDDNELIALIRRRERLDAAAVFAGLPPSRATFSDLFDGNRDVLERVYAGQSDMDYALIGMLSFWTGRDAIRTERIMRRSALYREKWDSQRGKDTYIRYSILRQFRSAHAEGRAVLGSQRTVVSVSEVRPVDTAGAVDQPQSPQLVTVTLPAGDKYQAVKEHRAAFATAGDPEALEHAALIAKNDTRLDGGALEGLAHDLLDRFEQLQTRRKITHCRDLLRPDTPPPPSAAGGHRECTEFGNVMRMMDAYGASLMYVDETEQWYRWDEFKWVACSPAEINFLAEETVRSLLTEARNEEQEDYRARLMQWANDSQKFNMVRNMVSLAKQQPRVFVRAAVLDSDTNVLGAPNGLIDLVTGELLPPDRNRRVTQCVAVDYNPHADAPWFKQTVRDAFFGDMELITFFKRLMGYTLLGKPKESKLIIPYGHGSNGKSTIIGAIQRVMGDYAKVAPSETFVSIEGAARANGGGPREDLVRLKGSRFLWISEVDESAHLKEAIVKSLTGDDVITARGVHATQSVQYRPTFVPVMPTNHKPIIKGDDNGIWRRIMLVPFERNFETDPHIVKDADRPAKIATEAAGVLRWLIEGALEYQREGLNIPLKVTLARDAYRDEMDLLKDWIDTRLAIDEEGYVTATDLFMSWQQYATPKGLFKLISTANALSRKLVGRQGFKRVQNVAGHRGRGWVGVRLKTAAEITFNG